MGVYWAAMDYGCPPVRWSFIRVRILKAAAEYSRIYIILSLQLEPLPSIQDTSKGAGSYSLHGVQGKDRVVAFEPVA